MSSGFINLKALYMIIKIKKINTMENFWKIICLFGMAGFIISIINGDAEKELKETKEELEEIKSELENMKREFRC